MAEKRSCIDADNPDIPVYRQCKLLRLSKAAYYYKTRDKSCDSPMKMSVMYPVEKTGGRDGTDIEGRKQGKCDYGSIGWK